MKGFIIRMCSVLVSFLLFVSCAHAERIVIFGATGNIGEKLVSEALDRGHEVVGISRSPENFSYTEENFIGVAGNPTVLESVQEVIQGADIIINAVGGREEIVPEETAMYQSALAITEALSHMGDQGPQILVMAGGSTMAATREDLLENMPASFTEGSTGRALYLGHWGAYEIYQASNVNWTLISPPFSVLGWREGTGEDFRSGVYRTSTAGRVFDEEGKNVISVSDLAVAVIDFAESGDFIHSKVALGY